MTSNDTEVTSTETLRKKSVDIWCRSIKMNYELRKVHFVTLPSPLKKRIFPHISPWLKEIWGNQQKTKSSKHYCLMQHMSVSCPCGWLCNTPWSGLCLRHLWADWRICLEIKFRCQIQLAWIFLDFFFSCCSTEPGRGICASVGLQTVEVHHLGLELAIFSIFRDRLRRWSTWLQGTAPIKNVAA